MARRLACALWALALLGLPTLAVGQAKAPKLSKEQRQSLMAAVDAARTATPISSEDAWEMHLLRASDGSHYVAFSAQAPPDLTPTDKLALYVRLEPRPTDPPSTQAPRSAVEEWLLGQRSDPLPMRAARVVTVPSGELPMGGTAATMTRDGSGQNSAALALLERQREKARQEQEARERARREEMEGRARTASDLMPFEDFDLDAHVVARSGRPPAFRRAITAGPGDYDVVVSWAVVDARNRPTRTGAFRQTVTLPAVKDAGLGLGSVILADAIRTRNEIYDSSQQSAHPYTIGNTEIEPALDRVFTNDERLAVAFQVFDAAPSPTGKPDVGVAFRLFRRTEQGETPGPSLAPLEYNENTLPADFNLLLGHPLLAAFAAPLRTLPRGDYRLAIAAVDRIARTTATAETRFRVIATAKALLADAPPMTARISRARFTEPAVLDRALDALAPAATRPAPAQLLTLARERRFAEILASAALPPPDQGTGLLFQSLAALVLGDTPRTMTVQLRRALESGAAPGVTQYFLGASLALEGRDEDALEAWEAARRAEWPMTLLALPMAEAHLRQGRLSRAGEFARATLEAGATAIELVRLSAAADIADGRFARALETLAPHLAAADEDTETQWLALHALFASMVAGEGPGADAEGRQRLVDLATRYGQAGGRNKGIAEEWRAFVTSSGSAAVP
jgi:hypothetical protein